MGRKLGPYYAYIYLCFYVKKPKVIGGFIDKYHLSVKERNLQSLVVKGTASPNGINNVFHN